MKRKVRIPIEQVQIGDIVQSKEVVDVLHRTWIFPNYVRLTLKGGGIVDGYAGRKLVEVEKK
jgi:hypothetical protein